MKFICVALALIGSTSAFVVPSMPLRTASLRSMAMSAVDEPVTRSEALKTAFAAGAAVAAGSVVPGAAFADGAKSLATQSRARGIYGSRIANLKPLIDSGDIEGVLREKGVFALFNSGVYSTDKSKFKKADELAKAVISAADTGDKAALKSAYKEFMKFTEKKSGFTEKDNGNGQGLGSDFDYKSRTAQGTVYQR